MTPRDVAPCVPNSRQPDGVPPPPRRPGAPRRPDEYCRHYHHRPARPRGSWSRGSLVPRWRSSNPAPGNGLAAPNTAITTVSVGRSGRGSSAPTSAAAAAAAVDVAGHGRRKSHPPRNVRCRINRFAARVLVAPAAPSVSAEA